MQKKVISKKQTAMTIAEALSPLLWLNQILGLAIFEVADRSWPKLTIFYVCVRNAAYGLALWYSQHVKYEERNRNSYQIIVFDLILFINVGIAAISNIVGLMNYKKTKVLLKKIALIDETLEIFGIDPEHSQAFKENLRTLCISCFGELLMFSSTCIVTSFLFQNPLEVFIEVIVNTLPFMLNATAELNFAVKISTLGKRFVRLNALIQSITITTQLKSLNTKNCDKYQNILKRNQSKVAVKPNFYYRNRSNIDLLLGAGRQLHLDLCTMSREVNNDYSKRMLLQMASSFLLITGLSYCFYLVYKDPFMTLTNRIQNFVNLGISIGRIVARLLYVVYISDNVITEAQKTSQIAQEIQVPRTQSKLINEIHQFSLQIEQHPLSFNASGLVVLDFSYVRGFFGSVTTYFMLLIQNHSKLTKATNTLTNVASDNNNTSNYTYSKFDTRYQIYNSTLEYA